MKKLKIFIFLCLVLLLSGCSVEYDLTLNDDFTVSEKVVATEKTKRKEDAHGRYKLKNNRSE